MLSSRHNSHAALRQSPLLLLLLLHWLLLLLFSPPLSGQQLDLMRASVSCRPGGAGQMAFFRRGTGLEFPAAFAPDGAPRAVWDLPLQLDLSQMASLRLRLYVVNPNLASQYNVYIKAGSTWYAAEFTPTARGRWEEVIIPKTEFFPEGSPSSWQLCTMLRLAAWKGNSGNLALHAAEIEFTRPNLSMAILRSAGGGVGSKVVESYRHARHLGAALHLQGLQPAVFEEDDSALSLLLPYHLLYVPLPDAASSQQISTLVNYLRRGGKAVVFHALPPPLAAQMGFPSGKFLRATQLSDGLASVQPDVRRLPSALPFRQHSSAFIAVSPADLPRSLATAAWWSGHSGVTTGWPAVLESTAGFWMTHVYLHQEPEAGGRMMAAMAARNLPNVWQIASKSLLQQAELAAAFTPPEQLPPAAREELNKARQAYAGANYQQVATASKNCREALLNADKPRAQAKANEFRAAWMRNARGLPGKSWEETVLVARQCQLNAVFPYFLTAYWAAYPSRLTASDGYQDLIAESLQACRRQAVQVHAWMACLRVEEAPAKQLHAWKKQGRLQVDANNQAVNWLCPTNPENRILLTRLAAELAQKYALDGIHLDLIRYPQTEACYCQLCRKAFADTGRVVEKWPAIVRQPGTTKAHWGQFRRQQISSLVAEIATAARAARPGIMVSAAVYPDWQSARDTVGQDWVTWCRNGVVDFVCPMNYRAASSLFASDLQRQLQQLGQPGKLVPGIGVSVQRLSSEELARQIAAARQAQVPGFALFELGAREALDVLPKLKW